MENTNKVDEGAKVRLKTDYLSFHGTSVEQIYPEHVGQTGIVLFVNPGSLFVRWPGNVFGITIRREFLELIEDDKEEA